MKNHDFVFGKKLNELKSVCVCERLCVNAKSDLDGCRFVGHFTSFRLQLALTLFSHTLLPASFLLFISIHK